MDKKERKQLVLAMETVVRSLNDEERLNSWLMGGVADGDLNSDSTWADVDDWYVEDGHFTDIMNLFCRIMKYATINGCNGILYCDGIIS